MVKKEISKRNIYLDYIRGAACIAVVLFHYTTRYPELYPVKGAWPFGFAAGGAAVSAFFILSGYLSSFGGKTGATEYIKKKALRLYPAYLLCVPLTWALTRFFLPERCVGLRDMLLNLTMLHFFIGVESVDGTYWFLKNELIFYLLIFIVVILLKKRRALPALALLWAAAIFALSFLSARVSVPGAADVILIKKYAHNFIAGIGIFFIFEKGDYPHKKAVRLLAVADIAAACACAWFFSGERINFVVFIVSLALVAGAAAAHGFLKAPPEKICKILAPFAFLSSISYPLYLIHQNIGYIILNFLRSLGAESEFIVIIPLAVMICAAYLINRFIEKPITRRFLKKTR